MFAQVHLVLIHVLALVPLRTVLFYGIGHCWAVEVALFLPIVPLTVVGWLSVRPWVPFLAVA